MRPLLRVVDVFMWLPCRRSGDVFGELVVGLDSRVDGLMLARRLVAVRKDVLVHPTGLGRQVLDFNKPWSHNSGCEIRLEDN